jgi:hypothetical protein
MYVMRRRSVMVFLVLVLLVGAYPGLFEAGGGTVYAAHNFAGGSGTLVDPYQIASAEQLDEIRNYLDDHFMLINDIDMSVFNAGHPWEPIGDETSPFIGSLDGQDYRIINLNINERAAVQPVGLFSVLGTTSTIRNLTIEAVEVNGRHYVGILAGINHAIIHNVGVTGSVYGENYVGGLAGHHWTSSVTNSYAIGIVTGLSNVGGLLGRNNSGNISYSYAAADVTGTVEVGGFIGKQVNAAGITNSYALGNVIGCEDSGGLVGENEDSNIANSFAGGLVKGLCGESEIHSDSIGGLVGDNSDGWIAYSYAVGRVTGGSPIGAVAGNSGYGRVTNSYYDLETTGQSDYDAQGLTSEEMKDWRNYIGWDFVNDWDIHSLHHYGYPYVKDIQAFITYAGNGTDHSSEQYVSHSYMPGSSVEIQDIPHDWTKAGHRFNEWKTEIDGSGDTYRPRETIVLNSDVLLYPDWIQLNPPTPSSSVTVHRSNNANLAQLIVKAGGEQLALTPEFSAGTTSYQVETTADEVTIQAVSSDVNATVAVDIVALAGEHAVTLTDGVNEFEIFVRAENGRLQTYDLTILRLTKPGEPDSQATSCAFRDTKGHWAELLICEALEIGIVEGYSETSFQPQASITRVEFMAILLRVLGIHSESAGNGRSFTDQEQIPNWADAAVDAAVEQGILQGYSDRTLRPMQHVNRSEMVVMLAKAMKWGSNLGDTSFADDAVIPAWARGYVNDAVQRNLIYGREGNRFSPMESATRAEATALLLRLWHAYKDRENQ